VCNTGKRRRGNPEALARLAKRAKPAAFDDEGPADEPQAGYQLVPWFHETALLRETRLRGRSASTLFSCRRMRKRSMGRQSKGRSSSLPRSWAASRISSHRSMPPRWHAARPRPVQRPPPQPVTQTKSFRPSGATDHALRGKVTVKQSLQVVGCLSATCIMGAGSSVAGPINTSQQAQGGTCESLCVASCCRCGISCRGR
jgi:hypothetical protein